MFEIVGHLPVRKRIDTILLNQDKLEERKHQSEMRRHGCRVHHLLQGVGPHTGFFIVIDLREERLPIAVRFIGIVIKDQVLGKFGAALDQVVERTTAHLHRLGRRSPLQPF